MDFFIFLHVLVNNLLLDVKCVPVNVWGWCRNDGFAGGLPEALSSCVFGVIFLEERRGLLSMRFANFSAVELKELPPLYHKK